MPHVPKRVVKLKLKELRREARRVLKEHLASRGRDRVYIRRGRIGRKCKVARTASL